MTRPADLEIVNDEIGQWSENIELYVLKVLSDSREEILERLSSPFSPETIREMQEITRKHDAAIAAKEREKVQPFIDLARVLA